MESNTRSPIFSDFGELLEGIVTVRAFSAERRFLNNLHVKIDNTTKVRSLRFNLLWDRSSVEQRLRGHLDLLYYFRQGPNSHRPIVRA